MVKELTAEQINNTYIPLSRRNFPLTRDYFLTPNASPFPHDDIRIEFRMVRTAFIVNIIEYQTGTSINAESLRAYANESFEVKTTSITSTVLKQNGLVVLNTGLAKQNGSLGYLFEPNVKNIRYFAKRNWFRRTFCKDPLSA